MSLTKRLGLIVGAAASLNSAMAQTALDQSRAYQNELFSDARERVNQRAATAFTVNLHGYEQIRYNVNMRDDAGLDDDMTIGFQNARTRINLGGNVFNEDWGYFIQFGWSDDTAVGAPVTAGGTATTTASSTSTSGFNLEDAYATYKIGNGWDLKAGQFKLPFLREELVGDTNQLAMDRSVLNNTFTQARSQGVQVGFTQDNYRLNFAFSDGFRTANTDFDSAAEADIALTGRGEFMWAGAWNQADDFTSWQNSSFFGMVGAAAHYQTGGGTFNSAQTFTPGPPTVSTDPADVDILGLTADVTIKGNGWNAFAAAVLTQTDPGDDAGFAAFPGSGTPGGAAFGSQTDFGILVQGGIFVAPQWELFGRLDIVIPDSGRTLAGAATPADDEMTTLTIGANYYISPDSQAAKFTAQLQYFLDQQSTGIATPSTLTGLLGSGEDGQFTVSAQLQLGF